MCLTCLCGAPQFRRQLVGLCRAPPHPKMKALRDVLLDHFGLPLPDSQEPPPEPAAMRRGRVIVFSSYRESVYEILAMLQKHEPYIKARCEPKTQAF